MNRDEKIEQVFGYVATEIEKFQRIEDLGLLKVLTTIYVISHIESETGDDKRASMLRVIPHGYLCDKDEDNPTRHRELVAMETRIFNWLKINYGTEES